MRVAQPVAIIVALVSLVALPASAVSTVVPSWRPSQVAQLPAGASGLVQGYLPVLSCPSTGNCTVIGLYDDGQGHTQGLALNQVGNSWLSPTTIVSPVGASSTPEVTPYGLSCATAGNCVAVGTYQVSALDTQGFIASEVAGRWRNATQAAMPSNALAQGQSVQLRSVVCSSAGNCSATGSYLDNTKPLAATQGLVMSEVNNVWSSAQEVQLPADTNANPNTALTQIACGSAGNCSATGSYLDANNVQHGLLVNEVAGAWQPAAALEPPADASTFAHAQVSSITCTGALSCTAIGTYFDVHGASQGFTVREVSGRWQYAITMRMPSDEATNPHVFFYGFAGITCVNATNCATGGQYRDSTGDYEGFFINEVNGIWSSATTLLLPPGSLMAGKNGGVVAVSCRSLGNCSAGAAYLDATNTYQALIINEVNGIWRTGIEVVLPGGATGIGIAGGVYSVVCHADNHCSAEGSYLSSPTTYQGFVLQTN